MSWIFNFCVFFSLQVTKFNVKLNYKATTMLIGDHGAFWGQEFK